MGDLRRWTGPVGAGPFRFGGPDVALEHLTDQELIDRSRARMYTLAAALGDTAAEQMATLARDYTEGSDDYELLARAVRWANPRREATTWQT